MPIDIVPLERQHLASATALFSARYRALRERVPSLPARYADPSAIAPRLEKLLGIHPGVAAIQNETLIGFLTGFFMSSFRGQPAMFSPEWANSAQLAESRTIYEHMYTHIAPQWLAQGASTHLISLMAHDQTAIAAWQWLGFGYLAVDGVRNLNPIAHCAPGIQIRQAYIEDLDALLDLDTALVRYLAGAPTYLAGADPEDPASLRAWLTDPDRVIWLACRDAERLAFLRIGPSSEGACALIQDKDTTSITGAFTVEHARGSGIATALLDRALGWARDNGYARCAVDFEPMNTLAARFWLRHFAPVSFALTRHIDRP